MNLNLALRTEWPTFTSEISNEAKIEKWDCSNRMRTMIMKDYIIEAFRGNMFDSENAKKFLEGIE